MTSLLLAGCTAQATASETPPTLRIVTTTGILADLVRNVGGERVIAESVIPEGADPHAYEPSLRDVRTVVYADAAFTNYLMLEEQAVIKMVDANLPAGRPNVSLAESAVKFAAQVIPLVEDVSLDAVWLGARVTGGKAAAGLTRSSEVRLRATSVDGPGTVHAYLTGSFGDITHYFNLSGEGAHGAAGFIDLPPDAHTHLTWAFTKPGAYRLSLSAELAGSTIAAGTVTFAVGIDPSTQGRVVIAAGHADVAVDLAAKQLALAVDEDPRPEHSGAAQFELDDVIVSVPNTTLQPVPGDPAFRVLGRAGDDVFQLPQAVLGKHVHGEIDPHLWHDARNAIAYVRTIEDTLSRLDPAGAGGYAERSERYIEKLEAVDDYMRDAIAAIPESRRQLVTTHDAFGYLARAYGMQIAGFVTPNPAVEPSIAERRRLTLTLSNLDIPAVFLEPNLASRSSTLVEVAREQGIAVCPILGDAFDQQTRSYLDLMRFNADSLRRCLTTP